MELLNLQVESYTYYNTVSDEDASRRAIPDSVVKKAREITRSKKKWEWEYETFLHNYLFFNPKIRETLAIEPLTKNGEEVAFIWRNFDFIYRIYLFDIIEEFLKLLKKYPQSSPPINIDISELAKNSIKTKEERLAAAGPREAARIPASSSEVATDAQPGVPAVLAARLRERF